MSGSIANFPEALWFKILFELLNRLPLSLITANSRMAANADYSVSIDSCLRSCNVVFEVLVAQIKRLRKIPDFQSFWLRFTSILATNTNILPRGAHFHEEMLEMIAALMRLLRPPNVPVAQTIGVQPPLPSDASKQPVAAPFGFLFLWSAAPAPVPAPAPPPPPPTATAAIGISPSEEKEKVTCGGQSDEDDDGSLLALSWKTMCSLNPSLQANLKLKNPQLVSDLIRFVDIQEKKSGSVAAPWVNSPSSSERSPKEISTTSKSSQDENNGTLKSENSGATTAPPSESNVRKPSIRSLDARTHIV